MIRLVDAVNYSKVYVDIAQYIKMLPKGWDGDKAPSGDEYPIDEALNLLHWLREKGMPVPWVYATKRRSIQFEWDMKNKDYFEVEVYYHFVSVFRVTNPQLYTYHTDKQDYKHQDIIFEQIERWNLGLPFLVKAV